MLGFLPCGRTHGSHEQLVSLFWSLDMATLDAVREAGFEAWGARVVELEPKAAGLVDELRRRGGLDALIPAAYSDTWMPRISTEPSCVFLGDAAHACSPQLGQGANLALVDAWTLAESVAACGADAPAAVRRYDAARRWRLRFYQLNSRMLTPVFQSDSAVVGTRETILHGAALLLPAEPAADAHNARRRAEQWNSRGRRFRKRSSWGLRGRAAFLKIYVTISSQRAPGARTRVTRSWATSGCVRLRAPGRAGGRSRRRGLRRHRRATLRVDRLRLDFDIDDAHGLRVDRSLASARRFDRATSSAPVSGVGRKSTTSPIAEGVPTSRRSPRWSILRHALLQAPPRHETRHPPRVSAGKGGARLRANRRAVLELYQAYGVHLVSLMQDVAPATIRKEDRLHQRRASERRGPRRDRAAVVEDDCARKSRGSAPRVNSVAELPRPMLGQRDGVRRRVAVSRLLPRQAVLGAASNYGRRLQLVGAVRRGLLRRRASERRSRRDRARPRRGCSAPAPGKSYSGLRVHTRTWVPRRWRLCPWARCRARATSSTSSCYGSIARRSTASLRSDACRPARTRCTSA